MAKVDLSLARKKHLEWKSVLRAFLDGRSTLSEDQAVSHKECSLGRWYYAEGISEYGNLPEFKEIEQPHAEMHATVRRVIQLANAGNMAEAEQEFRKVDPLSREVVGHLNDVEMKINAGVVGWAGIFKRLTIKTKIIGYGALVTLLVAVVGYLGYAGVGDMHENTGKIGRAAGLVEASKEMKIAVARDMQMIMEILAVGDPAELEAVWKEHAGFAADFDTYGGAILQGAKTPKGEIFAARDEALRKVVEEADGFHNREFLPKIVSLHAKMGEQLRLEGVRDQAMGRFETAYRGIMGRLEGFRSGVRARISGQLGLVSDEPGWLNGAVLAESAIEKMRIAVEEYAQEMGEGRRGAMGKRYAAAEIDLGDRLGVLLRGGAVGGAEVAGVSDASLRGVLEAIVASVGGELRESAHALFQVLDSIAAIKAEKSRLDHAADEVGEHMLELLDGVERVAKGSMANAAAESEQAATLLNTQMAVAVAIGALLATVFGFVITVSVTRPLAQALAVTREISEGNLDLDIQIDRVDEMGRLLAALKNTVEGLRTVVLEVRESSHSVEDASREISAGNADMSQRTEEQASSLEETASSMEELTSTVKQNADNAHRANQLAASAREEAEHGGAVVNQAIGAMSGINVASKKIAEIIGVVDEIAFQTNLLALNAAVEAARAGDQGRGFAVVAAEVRKLAQRSADSAKEISELIKDSVERVDEGSRLVDRSGETLNGLMGAVKQVADIVAEIAAASAEQSSGIQQVNKAVMQMDEVTQQNAAMVEQMAANAKGLEEQAGTLRELVDFFKVTA
ncbi:methyl-accepting chemotaxis protein [Endothiovibrio diazotrophicus]